MAKQGKDYIPGLGKSLFITADELDGVFSGALSGDLVLTVTPGTAGSSAAAVNAVITASTKFQKQVSIKLVNTAGAVHNWFSGTFAIAIADTSTVGVVAISGGLTNATFANGVATITLDYTGTFVAADTVTLTVTGGTKLGYTIANKTFVDTLIA